MGRSWMGQFLYPGVRLMLFTAPNPQKDKNESEKEKDDIDPFLCGDQSGIPREQNKGLTTT